VAVAVTVKVVARNSALRRLGEIDDFRSLSMPLRFNRTSSWELVLDADSPGVALLTLTGGLIVERDGVTILSGPVTGITASSQGGRSTVTVSGVDDTVWLERRLAMPVPSGPPYTSAAYHLVNGAAETVIRTYVDQNLGPSAIADRRLLRFALAADGGRGLSVKGSARFGMLLEVLQGLALAGGDLGFHIVQSDEQLVFEVYEPADMTSTAIFSVAFGNLLGFEYQQTVPVANYIYVAGEGEGTARTIVEGGDTTSIATHQRFETFRDRRDTGDTATLEQQRQESLDEAQARTSLAISPIDTDAVAFGRDYNLGDRVTVVIDGVAVQDVVREVLLTVTADRGEVLTPTLGTPGASSPRVPDLFAAVARQARRLSFLERR
jgi:hypothetical protein